MSHTGVVLGKRRARRRFAPGKREDLETSLAVLDVPILNERRLRRYKHEKVAIAERKFKAFRAALREHEALMRRLKTRWHLVDRVGTIMFFVGFFSLFGMFGLAEAMANGALVALGLLFGVVGVGSGWALCVGASEYYRYRVKHLDCMNIRREFKRNAVANARIEWRSLAYGEFILLADVPLEAQRMVARIRSRSPLTEFTVESTEPVEVVGLNKKLWAWKPDPVLRVHLDGKSFAVYVWDEEGLSVPARLLH